MNLEMKSTEEMLKVALKILPEWVCIVPEREKKLLLKVECLSLKILKI